MDARISEVLGLFALFALACASGLAATCFEPVYCRGGSASACFQHCVGLSDHIVTQDPALSVTHPDCLVRCDDACSHVCGETAVEADPGETPPGDGKATVSSRPRRIPQFKK